MSTPQQTSSGLPSSSVTTWVMVGLMSLGLSLLMATPVLAQAHTVVNAGTTTVLPGPGIGWETVPGNSTGDQGCHSTSMGGAAGDPQTVKVDASTGLKLLCVAQPGTAISQAISRQTFIIPPSPTGQQNLEVRLTTDIAYKAALVAGTVGNSASFSVSMEVTNGFTGQLAPGGSTTFVAETFDAPGAILPVDILNAGRILNTDTAGNLDLTLQRGVIYNIRIITTCSATSPGVGLAWCQAGPAGGFPFDLNPVVFDDFGVKLSEVSVAVAADLAELINANIALTQMAKDDIVALSTLITQVQTTLGTHDADVQALILMLKSQVAALALQLGSHDQAVQALLLMVKDQLAAHDTHLTQEATALKGLNDRNYAGLLEIIRLLNTAAGQRDSAFLACGTPENPEPCTFPEK